MTTKTKSSKGWIAGIIAALAASLCCITPVLALIGGLGGAASSFSWIEPYRPYFIGATVLVFAFAWYQKLKPRTKDEIACDCEEDKPSFWQTKTFLGIVTIVAAFLIAFPHYAKIFYPKPQQTQVIIVDRNNIETVQLNISGMDCEGCTAHINSEISKVKGVIEYNTSYEKGNSIVKYDKSIVPLDSIISAINATGYTVSDHQIISDNQKNNK